MNEIAVVHSLRLPSSVFRGAHMLFLPECFSLVGEKWQDTVAAGQDLDGEIITAMKVRSTHSISIFGSDMQGIEERYGIYVALCV
jgi:hypothetical protein